MTVPETKDLGCVTLAERLSRDPIPVEDAQLFATLAGEAIRKIQDSGRSHGPILQT
jgi:hypothetical protein